MSDPDLNEAPAKESIPFPSTETTSETQYIPIDSSKVLQFPYPGEIGHLGKQFQKNIAAQLQENIQGFECKLKQAEQDIEQAESDYLYFDGLSHADVLKFNKEARRAAKSTARKAIKNKQQAEFAIIEIKDQINKLFNVLNKFEK